MLLAALEEPEDSGTTKEGVKTPAKMLTATLSKHCMCFVNDHGKFSESS